MLRNLMMTMAYDGLEFHGWQFQPGLRTVQEVVEQALRRALRHRVHVIGCSRTDSGVHAAGYVANVFTPSQLRIDAAFRSVGSRLPKDVSLMDMREVPLTFHATRSAEAKLYRYRIHNDVGRPVEHLRQHAVYHHWQKLDIELMRQAARYWVGRHDFTSFASSGNDRFSNVRTVYRIDIYREGLEIRVDIEGDGFLYKMVRNIVGTLCEFGRGRYPIERAPEILAAKDRTQAGGTAPARGLSLQWVRYNMPALPEPTPDMLHDAAHMEETPKHRRANVDAEPLSTAPLPRGIEPETDEPCA